VSINKNFVVKNGFEVSTDLILADADTRKVGIGTTRPERELQVAGGIGATNFYLTGIGTFVDELNVGLGGTVLTVLGIGNSIGIGTALPAYLLDIRSPVSTGQTALYVQGDVRITGDIQADDIVFDDAEIQDLTVTDTLIVAGLSTFNSNVFINAALNVSGISTLGSYVDINDSVDISNDLNVVGLSTLGGYVDINNSLDVAVDLNVGGLTTLGGYVDINDSVDISNDLNVSGITTLATADINSGEIDVTRIETGDLSVTGIATIATISVVGAALSSLIVYGIATLETVDINAGEIDVTRIETGDLSVTGIATISTVDINGGDIEVSNVDTIDLSVTGIATLGTVLINSGIITATSGIVTYYGDGQYLDLSGNPTAGIGIGTTGGLVGYGITFIDFYGVGVSTTFYDSSVGIATIFFEGGGSGTIGIGTEFPIITSSGDLFYNINYGRLFVYYDEVVLGVGTDAYWVDAAPFNIGLLDIGDLSVSNLTVTNNANILGITTLSSLNVANINSSGIVTATAFVGDGSGLTGAGSTVFDDTTTDQEFFPLFTNITTGTITASGISTSKLTYNPFTGTITVIDLNTTSDISLKTNVKTVGNALETVDQLRGVSFDWKETGKSSYGVIAQELEEVLPELVKQGEIKSVNYNGIIGVLIEAIKELKMEVEDLKRTK
jgi:hypothetical protein